MFCKRKQQQLELVNVCVSTALKAELDCSSDADDGYAMKVYLNKTIIDYLDFTQDSLAFSNASCAGAVLENGYYVLSTPNYDACGTERTVRYLSNPFVRYYYSQPK